MNYFHVLVSTEPDGSKLRCIFRDLSEEILMRSFVKPYRRGRNLLSNGEVISLSSLRKVVIAKTDVDCEPLLKSRNDGAKRTWESNLRGDRGIVILGLPFTFGYDDLANFGENVTDRFITEAPGQVEKPHVFIAALSNPWLVGVGGAVIAAGIGAWLKWN
jgi:hypothetical protein